MQGKGSLQNLSTIKSANKHFGHWRALSLTSKAVSDFIRMQLDAGYANASVNRTTGVLKQAFKLAKLQAPEIIRLDESGNVRKGFLSRPTSVPSRTICRATCGISLAFCTRRARERAGAASLTWQDVESGSIELRAEHAKNGKARSVPLEGELADIIERRRAARQYRQGKVTHLSEFVFHRNGEPIREFRKAWATACLMAGLGKLHCPECDAIVDATNYCAKCERKWKREAVRYRGRLVHDLRRSRCET